MDRQKSHVEFLRSALCVSNCCHGLADFTKWFDAQRDNTYVSIDLVPFSDLNGWQFDRDTGNLHHESGRFFSIEGIHIETNWGVKPNWEQPIIYQPEIGILGILSKKINGVLHFLMQAKIEPGNIDYVQLSPTLQATKSNYTRVHKGKTPLYLEYFSDASLKKGCVLLDQLQSEQGARFLKKRNRNIIIEIEEDIPVYDNFFWLTLGQIKHLLQYDNVVNMDTRTVLSGISFGDFPEGTIDFFEMVDTRDERLSEQYKSLLISALESRRQLHTLEEIISWITTLKTKFELNVRRIPLNLVDGWVKTAAQIHHVDGKYFSVVAANIEIGNREVTKWSQPLVRPAQEGILAFIVKPINGVYHFLVQAKLEAGNLDILELAPTVQCLTGNYRKGQNEYKVPFLDRVLEAAEEQVIFRAMLSEEGGRFYKEQNLNMIMEVDEDDITALPENYCWMTLNQLFTFIKFNNYLNIQARSLLSAIQFQTL
jgi:dTDP-4-dehydro-6-deoxy-alpha-D-glucopyranose 2,3-dehydratase